MDRIGNNPLGVTSPSPQVARRSNLSIQIQLNDQAKGKRYYFSNFNLRLPTISFHLFKLNKSPCSTFKKNLQSCVDELNKKYDINLQAFKADQDIDSNECVEIGRGKHGVVYQSREDNESVIKVIDIDKSIRALSDVTRHKKENRSILTQNAKFMAFRVCHELIALYQLHAIENELVPTLKSWSLNSDGSELKIVMKKINGETLNNVLKNNALSIDQRREIFQNTKSFVEKMHAAGSYHRDIKQENIIVNKNLRVGIVDYGSSVSPQLRLENDDEFVETPSGRLDSMYTNAETPKDKAIEADEIALEVLEKTLTSEI